VGEGERGGDALICRGGDNLRPSSFAPAYGLHEAGGKNGEGSFVFSLEMTVGKLAAMNGTTSRNRSQPPLGRRKT